MNFTREPIILTVITPKEGCKLVIRNALGGQEDIFVDAIEVISFQEVVFFRSLERPKSFLFPTSHYEVIEVKETRMVLKSATAEKSIKIGGGARPQEERRHPEDSRQQQQRPQGPQEERKPQEDSRQQRPQNSEEGRDNRDNKKKDKKRLKRRKPMVEEVKPTESIEKPQGGDAQDETQVSSSVLKKLFPPPNILIKERLARFKNEEFFEENILPERVAEEKKEPSTEKPDDEKNKPFNNDTKLNENESSDASDIDNEEKNKEESED